MNRTAIILGLSVTTLAAANVAFGYEVTYEVAYGSFTLVAAIISLTFLWLWHARATPLASGMALGWAGASSVMGWWWLFNIAGRPEGMQAHPALFLCLALYFTGAILHFFVIRRSFGVGPMSAGMALGATVLASAAIRAMF